MHVVSVFARFAALLLALAATASGSRAHHSQSIFDRDAEVTIRGRVVRYEWANPHVYVFVEQATAAGQVTWEFEAQPPAHMSRMGWSSGTLAVGEPVIVTGAPARDRQRNMALGRSLQKADGTLLGMGFDPELLSERRSGFPLPPDGLTGNWLTILSPAWRPLVVAPEELALTELGRATVASFSEAQMHPGSECVPFTSPFLTVFPDVKTIVVGADRIVIRAEFEGVERVIHMDAASVELAAPSLQGHSVGRWEGDTLVVETTHFLEHNVGIALGLPSSPEKRLLERFEPNEDGMSLTYHFELEDPVYLSEPYRGAVEWVYRPDLENSPVACDPEIARRFWEY